MAVRSVVAEATFGEFRKTMNETNTDIGDMTQLGNSFSGTPTDMVEACNAAPSVGFAIAMCAALG